MPTTSSSAASLPGEQSKADAAAGLVRLSSFAADADVATTPAHIAEAVRACLLYGLAVGIAALRVRSAHAACAMVDLDSGGATGPSTRFLDALPAATGSAALANAVLLSARVQGDSHPAGHIGGVVIPAALAVAESRNASGAELLGALLAAYEVALRIGRDHAADLSARGFRTTPAYGVFSAAAAAGRLLRLDTHGIATALGVAANFAGGLREYVDAGTEESPFQAGFAARNGIGAAMLVQSGWDMAAPTALHGKAGFFRAFAEAGKDYGERLTEGLGTEFELLRVTYKPYPICQFLRGVVEAVRTLRGDGPGGRLAELELRMNPFEADFVGTRFRGPFRSAAQTVMSAPFCAALAWKTGAIGYSDLRVFDDPKLLSLVERVTVISDAGRARYRPLVTARFADGSVRTAEPGGGADAYAVSIAAAEEMTAVLLGEVGIGEAWTEALVAQCRDIASAASVRGLIEVVTGAITSSRRAESVRVG